MQSMRATDAARTTDMPDQRIAFFGNPGHSRHHFVGGIPRADGLPRVAGTGIDTALSLYEVTDNKGNMIHGEAPARIFQSDRHHSCYVSGKALIVDDGWSAERVAEELSARFDLVVYSTANAIRPNLDPGGTARMLDSLRCEFVVLGMGMQNALPPTTEGLHPNLISLLDVCNRKASVFGVRGLQTEAWLKSVGYGNAKALGCPSLYVYPSNILRISPPDPAHVGSALTGGYIYGRVPRSTLLVELFEGYEAHYVMQEGMAILKANGLIDDEPDLYNDATGELRKDVIDTALEQVHRRKMPFASYRWFQDPNAWRHFASRCDISLGDRLHGGIVALQTGVPTILIAEDQRVSEVADFFSIPRISVREARDAALQEIVAQRLDRHGIAAMQGLYLQRFREFETTFAAIGVPLTVSAAAARGIGVAQPAARRRAPPVPLVRRLKDWVADAIY